MALCFYSKLRQKASLYFTNWRRISVIINKVYSLVLLFNFRYVYHCTKTTKKCYSWYSTAQGQIKTTGSLLNDYCQVHGPISSHNPKTFFLSKGIRFTVDHSLLTVFTRTAVLTRDGWFLWRRRVLAHGIESLLITRYSFLLVPYDWSTLVQVCI